LAPRQDCPALRRLQPPPPPQTRPHVSQVLHGPGQAAGRALRRHHRARGGRRARGRARARAQVPPGVQRRGPAAAQGQGRGARLRAARGRHRPGDRDARGR
ncbi:hypothetical protein BN1708_019105, partial [Verticillium longisporum]